MNAPHDDRVLTLLFAAADVIRVINANAPDPAIAVLRYAGIGLAFIIFLLLIGLTMDSIPLCVSGRRCPNGCCSA